ncbi:MAG TPA: hypothetical protein VK826_08970 [Bacteroidia bacterium]|nr:hypothetical protein [Bacteroidia bacterium]
MDKLRYCFLLAGFVFVCGAYAHQDPVRIYRKPVAEIPQSDYSLDVVSIAHTHMWCLPSQEVNNYWNPFDRGPVPLVKITIFDPPWQKDSTGIYFEDVHPNNLSANNPNEKPQPPDPPLLPEEPWYNAVLPSILSVKRKA